MKIKFCELDIGQPFFDEYSGDYWEKINDTQALLLEGDNNKKDYFDPEELIITGK